MVFSSLIFLYAFFSLSLLAYLMCETRKAQNVVLLIFSLIFYAWGEPKYVLLLMFMAFASWVCALGVDKAGNKKTQQFWVAVAAVVDIGLIGYFKYAGLICGIFGTVPDFIRSIALPIGISFYTFQLLTYVIDVYRGDAPAQKSYWNVLLYAALFHQCIAGPIVRYKTVDRELFGGELRKPELAEGVTRFSVGLAKKALLGNPCGELAETLILAESVASDPAQLAANLQAMGELPVLGAWLGLAAYALHIYLDFSAYSDMAIGMGRMIGLHYLENFNYPYISRTVTEFWRRWHMSLGTFFRDYVYIPLGGSRRSKGRMVFNTFVVWALTGLWHGASWNFVLWGGYYAVLLILEKSFLLKALQKIPAAFRHAYAMIAVALGWALFYFEDMGQLGAFLLRLFTPVSSQGAANIMLGYLPMMAAAIFAAMPFAAFWTKRKENSELLGWAKIAAGALVMLLCVAALAKQSYNPFIYFRF